MFFEITSPHRCALEGNSYGYERVVGNQALGPVSTETQAFRVTSKQTHPDDPQQP